MNCTPTTTGGNLTFTVKLLNILAIIAVILLSIARSTINYVECSRTGELYCDLVLAFLFMYYMVVINVTIFLIVKPQLHKAGTLDALSTKIDDWRKAQSAGGGGA